MRAPRLAALLLLLMERCVHLPPQLPTPRPRCVHLHPAALEGAQRPLHPVPSAGAARAPPCPPPTPACWRLPHPTRRAGHTNFMQSSARWEEWLLDRCFGGGPLARGDMLSVSPRPPPADVAPCLRMPLAARSRDLVAPRLPAAAASCRTGCLQRDVAGPLG